MNFLAHIYLSGNDELITIGNFIADGIRGTQYLSFSEDIQIGILLHREIDTFTDTHPTVRRSTKRLHKNYGHYSGVIVDIFYDHFLAKNWQNYSNIALADYVNTFYSSLEKHSHILPQRYKNMMPIIIQDNWLLNYAHLNGIQSVLNGMNHRTKGISKMNKATKELKAYYKDFEADFTSFFEELIIFSNHKRSDIKQLYQI